MDKIVINGDGFYIIDKSAMASLGLSIDDIINDPNNVYNKSIVFVPIRYQEDNNAIVFNVDTEYDDKIMTSTIIEPATSEDEDTYEVERVDKIDYLPGPKTVEPNNDEKTLQELDLAKKIRQTPRARQERKKKTSDVSIPTNAGRHRNTKGGSKADSLRKLPTPNGLRKAGRKGGRKGGEGMKLKAKMDKSKLFEEFLNSGDMGKFLQYIDKISEGRTNER